jgi:hypothetical protein
MISWLKNGVEKSRVKNMQSRPMLFLVVFGAE